MSHATHADPATTLKPPATRAAAPMTQLVQRATAGPHRYLLLLSHMRSWSSVLAHLLGSSPDVQGCGETHIRYRHALDIWRLRRAIGQTTGRAAHAHWLLDKVLHNTVHPIDRYVGAERVRALIFVRRPEPAVASMLHLMQQRDPGTANVQLCCDHYVARLHRLREEGERYRERALYFDAERLVEQPQRLLPALTRWLGLSEPLGTHYRLGPSSGQEGFGDWLPNIRSGVLLGPEASTVRHAAPLPPMVLDEARAAYERCRTALVRSCAVLEPAHTV